MVLSDTTAAFKQVGVKASSHTAQDTKNLWQVAIDFVNQRGGLAGRKIIPSYYFEDPTQGTNASRSQAACTQFTEDQKVFAVVLDAAADLTMATCLAQHHTPAIDVAQGNYPYDQVDITGVAPYLVLPSRIDMSRFRIFVDTLVSQGYFQPPGKLALLRFDVPDQARTRDAVIVPSLRAHGLALTDDFAVSAVSNLQELGTAEGEVNNAVLRFRSEGVDHVMFLGSDLVLPLIFPVAAESQGYRPRYAVTTDDAPQAFMAGNAPAGQLHGTVGIGWEPAYDVVSSDNVMQGNPLWSACAAQMRSHGQPANEARRCTGLLFLELALRNAPSLTMGNLRAGIDQIGDTPYSTSTFGTHWGPGVYDGPSQIRGVKFDDSCGCFRYSTALIGAP